jgi:hypothetical protein
VNKDEARAILTAIVSQLRGKSRDELLRLIDDPQKYDVTAASGVVYQIEVEAWWDRHVNADLRVVAAIDDGGWSAFKPICDDFIVAPDGSFVGE